MPFATFTRVREVSSEDNAHLAENLIKGQSQKKWKTKNAGEKSAYVILEMTGCYQITGIDIGNEHSAFIEVLVGKSSCAPEDFTEILITSSFMTPTESKNSLNTNRVRCFNRDVLVPTAAEEKWSLVKILCTQPFNKHVSYGLSFIKIHINDQQNNSSITQKNIVSQEFLNKTTELCGKLKFRNASPDSEMNNSSSLFERWKKSKQNVDEKTTAASIRMASKIPTTVEPRCLNDDQKTVTLKANEKYLHRNQENVLFVGETEHTNNKNLDHLSDQIDSDKKRKRSEKERKSPDRSPKTVRKLSPKTSNSKSEGDSADIKNQNSSQENPTKKIKSSNKCRPFNQLLKGVVLVISGIPNPDRGDLRNKALALGAKYKADWDNTCTHLICAFKNTPKYNQVKGKGKIVTRSWIEKCYSLKKYLPWRRYALDSKELSQPESDEEISEELKETLNNTDLQTKNRRESEEESFTLALYDIYDNPNPNKLKCGRNSFSSGEDTDDEIKRIEKSTKADKKNSTSKILNIYEASTDDEDYMSEKFN